MKKVLIMGCPGAGKAKLAARLGRITGLDVYHIKDDRYSETAGIEGTCHVDTGETI